MIAKTFPFPKTFPAQERKTLRPVKSLRDHARWYRPGEGRVTYYWPGEAWEQALVDFVPGTRTMTLG